VVADLTTGVCVCAVLDLCDLHGPTRFKMLGNGLKVNLVVCKRKDSIMEVQQLLRVRICISYCP
jgi:hypothetical protein